MPAEVFLSMGSYETLMPGSGDARYSTEGDMVRDNQRFEAALKSRKYPGLRVQSIVVQDEDHLPVSAAPTTRAMC